MNPDDPSSEDQPGHTQKAFDATADNAQKAFGSVNQSVHDLFAGLSSAPAGRNKHGHHIAASQTDEPQPQPEKTSQPADRMTALEMQNSELRGLLSIHQQLINELRQQMTARPLPDPSEHPWPTPFIAQEGSTALQWAEKIVNSGSIVTMTGGRACASDAATNKIITLASNQFCLLEVRDPTTGCMRYVKVSSKGSSASPDTISGGTGESADGTTSTTGHAISFTFVTRVAYNSGGDKILYGYNRTVVFDTAGALVSISAETRFTVDATELCT